MDIGRFYRELGVGVSRVEFDGNTQPMISLYFWKINAKTDDPSDLRNYERICLTVPGAKSLLIDVKDAIDAHITKDYRRFGGKWQDMEIDDDE